MFSPAMKERMAGMGITSRLALLAAVLIAVLVLSLPVRRSPLLGSCGSHRRLVF
jgi:hypothetical protein